MRVKFLLLILFVIVKCTTFELTEDEIKKLQELLDKLQTNPNIKLVEGKGIDVDPINDKANEKGVNLEDEIKLIQSIEINIIKEEMKNMKGYLNHKLNVVNHTFYEEISFLKQENEKLKSELKTLVELKRGPVGFMGLEGKPGKDGTCNLHDVVAWLRENHNYVQTFLKDMSVIEFFMLQHRQMQMFLGYKLFG